MKNGLLLFFILLTLTACSDVQSDYTRKNINRILEYHGYQKVLDVPMPIDSKKFVQPSDYISKTFQLEYEKNGIVAVVFIFEFHDAHTALSEKAISIIEWHKGVSDYAKSSTSGNVSIILFTEPTDRKELDSIYRDLTTNMDSRLSSLYD
jgi:hypothetical protein